MMLVSKLNVTMAALSALICASAMRPAAADQPLALKKKDANAKNIAGQNTATDKDRLQGKWQIMSIAIEDKVIKREDRRSKWKDTFEKDLFVERDRFGQVGYSNAKVTLDETRNPKQITIQSDDGKQTFRGIYALDGDTLKVCMNGDGSDVRRPEEFVTKKGTPLILITLKKRPAEK